MLILKCILNQDKIIKHAIISIHMQSTKIEVQDAELTSDVFIL